MEIGTIKETETERILELKIKLDKQTQTTYVSITKKIQYMDERIPRQRFPRKRRYKF